MLLPTPARLRQVVRDEFRQRAEEGADVGDLAGAVAAVDDDPPRLLNLLAELARRPQRADFPYDEPTDFAALRAARPTDGPTLPPPATIDAAVADRIAGGWLGRCAGLCLGKPFECAPFMEDAGAVRRYLQVAGAWPLDDYVPLSAAACAAVGRDTLPCPRLHRGVIAGVEPDDDLHYTLMGLEVLERCGTAFTTADVAWWWTHRLPPAALFTAEEAALRNLVALGRHFEPHATTPVEWEQVRTWLNPWREWIGAQIRADGWALACPGRPERAAEFAWRDATLSHVKNGVYGALFCAAMIAAACVSRDPLEIVQAGLAEIPARSRLAEAVRRTVDRCGAAGRGACRFEEMIAWLWEEFGRYHCVHTINNAAAVVAALLLGGGDFGRTIGLAVMCGWDSDCNGATAGCIAGALCGQAALPERWTAPLRDTLWAEIPGYQPGRISACSARHVDVARRVAAAG